MSLVAVVGFQSGRFTQNRRVLPSFVVRMEWMESFKALKRLCFTGRLTTPFQLQRSAGVGWSSSFQPPPVRPVIVAFCVEGGRQAGVGAAAF